MIEQTVPQQKQSATGRNIAIIVGTVLLLGLIAIFAIGLQKIESGDLQGQSASNFTLPLFDQFGQDEITLSELRGQVVVINFWASWCVECFKEAPLLEQAWRDYQEQGVIFIGVDYLDTDKEGLAYMNAYDITYPSGPDIGTKIADVYAITGVPETFFIDKAGNIAHIQLGPIEKPKLYGLLDTLVAEE